MSNHQADMKNKNKGTSGTNKTLDYNNGNRGKQIQENQKIKTESQPKKDVK